MELLIKDIFKTLKNISHELKDIFVYYYYKSIPFLLLIFAPVNGAIVTIFLLVLLDLLLGMMAAKKEGYSITSRSARRSIPKLLVYEVTIAVLFLIETYLFFSTDFPVTKGATALIGVIEGKSILENLYRLTKIDFLHIVITKLQLLNAEKANNKDLQEVHIGKDNEKKES